MWWWHIIYTMAREGSHRASVELLYVGASVAYAGASRVGGYGGTLKIPPVNRMPQYGAHP